MFQILDATNKTIEAVMSGAAATNDPSFTASWADDTGSALTEGSSVGELNGATPVTLVAAPAAATRRVIKSLTICNIDTAPVEITINYNNNTVLRSIATVTLEVGDTWTFEGTYDDTGSFKQVIASAGSANTALSNLSAVAINTTLLPGTDDGAGLGNATHNFSDLFLASGALINYANSNVIVTHTSGILTVNPGDFRVTTAGTNTASVVTVGGTQTLTAKTITAATLSGAQQLAEGASLRLDAVLSADGAYSGTTIAGTAGATLAFGDVIYLAVADSRWELADASAASTSGSVLVGMCVLAAAADGDPTVILLNGNVRADAAFPTFTVSAPVYISETAGDVTNTAPTTTDSVTRVLGFGIDGNSMYFNPSNDYITHV